MMIRLFDLAGANPDLRFSPYCWRTRLALAHKGLSVDTMPWRFSDKAALAPSGQGRVPVIVDGQTWVSDSWAIAEYLDEQYPEAPSLFGSDHGRALARFHAQWGDTVLVRALAPILVWDVWNVIDEADKPYFRTSRERILGASLEEVAAGRDRHLESLRETLAPLAATLSKQPFLSGAAPLFADYAIFGFFQWARCVSDYVLVPEESPIAAWSERMLGLFDHLAGKAVLAR